jgi:hypothetical protein
MQTYTVYIERTAYGYAGEYPDGHITWRRVGPDLPALRTLFSHVIGCHRNDIVFVVC